MVIRARVLALLLLCLLLPACSKQSVGMLDGYYTAEAAAYHHGWKEFVTIYVRDDTIVTVEYNARNESGFIKSWDMDYMASMNGVTGTYPNEYTRLYAGDLLAKQSPRVDAVTGATTSYGSFQKLAAAAIEQAQQGDSTVAVVDTE